MTDKQTLQDAVVIERSFDAPVDLIWQMWTVPEHFQAWYGPDGASIPIAKLDVRVGGRRLVCMQIPTQDGPMRMCSPASTARSSRTSDASTPIRIRRERQRGVTFEHGNSRRTPRTTEVRVELQDVGGRTRMVMTHTGFPATPRALPAGRWRSTSSPPTSRHAHTTSAAHSHASVRDPTTTSQPTLAALID